MAAEIVDSLRTALLTMGAVTALVGTGADARIRPRFQQKEVIPANGSILIEVDDEVHLNDISGQGGREMTEITLTFRAPTRPASLALAEAARVNGTDPGTGLAAYGATPIDVRIDCWLEDSVTVATPKADGSDKVWWDTIHSYMTTQAETV